MRRSKLYIVARLSELMTLVPHAALELFLKFFINDKMSGTITFHFEKGELVGWSNLIKNYKTGGDTDE